MAAIRHFFMTRYADRDMIKAAQIEEREAEVARLGRPFGEHSVESERNH